VSPKSAGRRSAGILVYRVTAAGPEVFLVHPGGPFWAKKDAGAWSIPKGLCGEDEEPLVAAKRELREETGLAIDGAFVSLGDFKQPSGKVISAWAVEGDCDASCITSNPFTMEWPPKSGRMQQFPEVDRAAWLSLPEASAKIVKGQRPILERLREFLSAARNESARRG
jgi:predicted NUDIX family NTP pyrophosphohydrolase